jgi:chromosome segregation ATPase
MSTAALDVLKRELDAASKRAASVKDSTRADIDRGSRAQRELDNANREVTDLRAAIATLTAEENSLVEPVEP